MSNGLLVVAVIAAILLLIFGLWFLKRPEYKRYKSDLIYDVLWKWQWKGHKVIGLWCYCPTCKGALSFDDTLCQSTNRLNEKVTYLICSRCDAKQVGKIKGGDRRYVLTIVQREILRRALTKSFDLKKGNHDK